MANGIRTGDPRGFDKGRCSKFRKGSRVRQTPEEGRRAYRPKRCGTNNKDEDNSPKTLNDKKVLSSATTPSQSGRGSNDNERVLCILQSSSITEISPSHCLVSYPKHSLGILLLYRDAVDVFYSSSRLGYVVQNFGCVLYMIACYSQVISLIEYCRHFFLSLTEYYDDRG